MANTPSDTLAATNSSTLIGAPAISPLDCIFKTSVSVESLGQSHSETSATDNLTVSEMRNTALVQVFAKKGQAAQLCTQLGIDTAPGQASVTDHFTAMPLSPGQWMLSAEQGADGSFCASIKQKITDSGYVSEQSQGRVIIRISGSAARQVLQKGCRLDLHPRVASKGFCAQTTIAQVGVLLHQSDDLPSFDLHLYSGFAVSFWKWLTQSAAEFGYTSN